MSYLRTCLGNWAAAPLAALLGLCLAGSAARADIIQLYNTGTDNSGALLADASVDPHYSLVQSSDSTAPGPNAFVVNSNGYPIQPGLWMPNGPNSKWLAPMADQTIGNVPGTYTYEMKFNIAAGLNPATAQITGQWATDNPGIMFLNGKQVASILSEPTFQAFHAFSITSGFLSGQNVLDFQTINLAPPPQYRFINPTGLRVELSGTVSANTIPEPTSLVLAGMGVFGMVSYGVRRRLRMA